MPTHDPNDKRVQTAYHEAGHAVVAFELRRGVTVVTIVPSDENMGHIQESKQPSSRPDINSDAATGYRIEREIQILLAGEIAAAKLCGREPEMGEHGSVEDYKLAAKFAFRVGGDEEETTAYLTWLFIRTRNMVKNDRVWFPITKLAGVLLERKEMSGREARKVWREGLYEYMDRSRSKRRRASTD